MPRKKADHLHKYKRVTLGKNDYTVLKCQVPACTHYIRKDLAENALCACNRCGEPMILTKTALQLARPHCEDCTKKKYQTELDSLSELFDSQAT